MASDIVPVVVVVTDSDSLRDELTTVIESRSIGVIGCRTGAECIEARLAFMPLCIVIDLDMTELSGGLALGWRLRTQRDPTPLILIADHVDEAVQSGAASVNAFTLLEKPIPPLVLFAAIDEAGLIPRE